MRPFPPAATVLLLPILLLLNACSGSSNNNTNEVRVGVQGQFEKRILSSSGFSSSTQILPTRYCYAKILKDSDLSVLDEFYLDANGGGSGHAPRDTNFFVAIFAAYQVPTSPASSDFFIHGSVIDDNPATRPAPPFSPNFEDVCYVTSDTFNSSTTSSVTLIAPTTERLSGPFNIADQAITLFSSLRDRDATLRLPNIHTYFRTTGTPGEQPGFDRYPYVALNAQTQVIKSSSNRAIFTNAMNGLDAAGSETDEWDDGIIRESSAHLLFADYSYRADGSSAFSLLRQDSDNAYVARAVQSESTAAFVGGYCDFLAAASTNNPVLLDSYRNSSGALLVDSFDLSRHDQVPSADRSEFARGSVAASLWGIWKNALGGSSTGLQVFWNACNATQSYEYLNAPLACYPTYLTGLKRLAGTSASTIITNELSLENIGNGLDVTSSTYFNSTALWITPGALPFTRTGNILTDQVALGYYYDRDTTQSYRFVQGSNGPRTITLSATGVGLRVELFDTIGLLRVANASSTGNGIINESSLPAGTYVVRVRPNPNKTYTNSGVSYTLTVN